MAANDLIREAVRAGAVKGWDGFVWMMKIVVPVSLLTTLLDRSGWLARIDFLLQPAMGLLSLPPEAALPLLIGMLANIYGGIAAMVVLPLSLAQMTLVAIFLLTAHNLIQEGIIQAKSGLHPLKATLFRIGAATATVLCVAPFLDGGSAPAGLAAGAAEAVRSWGAVLQGWAGTTATTKSTAGSRRAQVVAATPRPSARRATSLPPPKRLPAPAASRMPTIRPRVRAGMRRTPSPGVRLRPSGSCRCGAR
ncbi:MAG: Nucleoside recognition [Alphaproteobacteria bacterium ADurb.BinA305]|nr:MAG: Nucleoside recognition [Alphaproteobacteria bacterium ADurb.BinA305]